MYYYIISITNHQKKLNYYRCKIFFLKNNKNRYIYNYFIFNYLLIYFYKNVKKRQKFFNNAKKRQKSVKINKNENTLKLRNI